MRKFRILISSEFLNICITFCGIINIWNYFQTLVFEYIFYAFSIMNTSYIMDRFGIGRIQRSRFHEWFDILYVLLEILKKKKNLKEQQERVLPRWKEVIESIYSNKYYSAIIHLINIFSLLLMFWREVMEAYEISNLDILPQWIFIAMVINTIYFVDLIFVLQLTAAILAYHHGFATKIIAKII